MERPKKLPSRRQMESRNRKGCWHKGRCTNSDALFDVVKRSMLGCYSNSASSKLHRLQMSFLKMKDQTKQLLDQRKEIEELKKQMDELRKLIHEQVSH